MGRAPPPPIVTTPMKKIKCTVMINAHHSPLQARKKHDSQQHPAPAVRASPGKRCRQLDLTVYPELEEEMDKMEDFFQMEHNLHRKGGHLHPETWRKVRMHILSESICMPMCLTLVRWHSV